MHVDEGSPISSKMGKICFFELKFFINIMTEKFAWSLKEGICVYGTNEIGLFLVNNSKSGQAKKQKLFRFCFLSYSSMVALREKNLFINP